VKSKSFAIVQTIFAKCSANNSDQCKLIQVIYSTASRSQVAEKDHICIPAMNF
jgi:hypothetical protein